MIRRATLLPIATLAALLFATSVHAAGPPCELEPKSKCFGLESLSASLSTTEAGAHPDLTFSFDIAQNPASEPNVFGLKDGYASTRDVRIELPPGLIGDPNVLGVSQQCTEAELAKGLGAECPNGSQIGITKVYAYTLKQAFVEPVYMMQPPGGDVVARVGFVAGPYPTFVNFRVRSAGDYGLTAEIVDASAGARLIRAETTTWGVPAAKSHDTERCTPAEAFNGCVVSEPRPPGFLPLPFMTNPTRCGVPLSLSVNVSSWVEPEFLGERKREAPFPEISGCNSLPFGPRLTVAPSSHRAAGPTGLDMTIQLPTSKGPNVLEPSQIRDIRIDLPKGLTFNPAAGDGLATCSPAEVGLGDDEDAHCSDAAKLASGEFEIGGLPRRLKGAIYLREPEPGNPFRIWVVADDLGAHVKLQGQLEVNKQDGQIDSVVLDNPQVPLREVELHFFAGPRAPLINPSSCGDYLTHYEFTPWSGGPPAIGDAPMTIDEGCDTGGFNPKLSGGSTNLAAGKHSRFLFTITREDGEQNPQGLTVTLPTGLAATFAGVARCEGAAAQSGACPAESRIGKVIAAVGAGPDPLWVPQPGKRPAAVYLSGPYKGAPLSIVAVVPKQAGPFDFGDEVVRSAVYVNPVTAQATAVADPLPQLIEGIPIGYRTIDVVLDRPGFTLNPTSCGQESLEATLTSAAGAVAHPSARFQAVDCASLPFKPKLGLKLRGGTKRAGHPALRAVVRPRTGDANIASTVVTLPHSAFLDQAHIRTICTRVQFAAGGGFGERCPKGAVYGHVTAITPLLEEPLSGPVYLRSSNHNLPDMVLALHGPPSLPIEIEAVGRIDSKKGGIRSSFEAIPDAPLTKVVLNMQGGKKGLIVNSKNLCYKPGKNRAAVSLTGHNGRASALDPVMQATKCGKHKAKHGKAKRKAHGKHRRRRHGKQRARR